VTSVLVVDDHRMFAEAIAVLLRGEEDFEEVDISTSGEEALDRIDARCYDVLLADVDLPGMSGIAVIARTKERCPAASVVVVTALTQPDLAVRAFEEGASGFVEKHHAAEDVVGAIRRAAAGDVVIPSESVREALMARTRSRTISPFQLTSREIEVLQAVANGWSTEEVAAQLHISRRTVQSHVQSVIDKMRVRSKLEAVLVGLREGIVRLEPHA
jgi:DNA-binding NarL/FixJ family response regulator